MRIGYMVFALLLVGEVEAQSAHIKRESGRVGEPTRVTIYVDDAKVEIGHDKTGQFSVYPTTIRYSIPLLDIGVRNVSGEMTFIPLINQRTLQVGEMLGEKEYLTLRIHAGEVVVVCTAEKNLGPPTLLSAAIDVICNS